LIKDTSALIGGRAIPLRGGMIQADCNNAITYEHAI
jgi:hypothetical protein